MNCPQAPALTAAPSHPGFLCFKVSLVHHCVPYTVVQLLSHVQLLATPGTATCQVSLFFTIFQSLHQFSSVQLLSRVRLFATPWTAARQASLSSTNSWSSLKLMSIKSVMPSSYLILCHPLLLLPPIPPSIRVFSNESTLHMRWPKYWSFNISIIPSKEIPGLNSFRMDWLDLLAVHGTLKSLLQNHSSKASVLRCSAFFTSYCKWFLTSITIF